MRNILIYSAKWNANMINNFSLMRKILRFLRGVLKSCYLAKTLYFNDMADWYQSRINPYIEQRWRVKSEATSSQAVPSLSIVWLWAYAQHHKIAPYAFRRKYGTWKKGTFCSTKKNIRDNDAALRIKHQLKSRPSNWKRICSRLLLPHK